MFLRQSRSEFYYCKMSSPAQIWVKMWVVNVFFHSNVVRKLFAGMPPQTIQILVDKLRPDFELCGYQRSLAWILEQL